MSLLALVSVLCTHGGCAGVDAAQNAGITVQQIRQLEDLDAVLPLMPDSIAAIYRAYDTEAFYAQHDARIGSVIRLLDSLNGCVPPGFQFDSLVIDHSAASFGLAGRIHHTFAISSSYFFLFQDARVLRSVVFHEFGHVMYDLLPAAVKDTLTHVWDTLGRASLLYLFTDGEYSHNAKFGGHPYDSPAELFASTYNLLHNNLEELDARVQYIDEGAFWTVRRLLALVLLETPV
ncbi:MAG: hypothetical protein HY962_09720 [Ignavibacteriae bacterium]|nr:hypothetical protein [Ignavibacteriota bacterium]